MCRVSGRPKSERSILPHHDISFAVKYHPCISFVLLLLVIINKFFARGNCGRRLRWSSGDEGLWTMGAGWPSVRRGGCALLYMHCYCDYYEVLTLKMSIMR